MTYIDVGDRIRDARKRMGLNQEQLAEMARLNRVTVAKYESGKVEPGAQALSRIADALEVTVDELLGRKSPDENATESPKTPEAKVLAAGMDKMPPEERDRALRIVKLFFEHKGYFDDEERNDDDEGQS